MCDPLSGAMFAISALSTAVGYVGQQEAADAQDEAYEQNRQNALNAFADKQRDLNTRAIQEQEAAANKKFENNLDRRAAQATAMVAAGESGVSGLSVDALFNDLGSRTARANANIDSNTDYTLQQLESEKRGQTYQTVDRINSVKRGQQPSLIDAGLRIAAAGVSSYDSYSRRQLRTTPR